MRRKHCTLPSSCCTVYPKKYAHGFVVLCFVVVMQSFIMNSHEVFIHIHQGCFAGTGAIVRLPQCQWSKPDGYGKISQCITTTKHSKAKTVCIFLGLYCTLLNYFIHWIDVSRGTTIKLSTWMKIYGFMCPGKPYALFSHCPQPAIRWKVEMVSKFIGEEINKLVDMLIYICTAYLIIAYYLGVLLAKCCISMNMTVPKF